MTISGKVMFISVWSILVVSSAFLWFHSLVNLAVPILAVSFTVPMIVVVLLGCPNSR